MKKRFLTSRRSLLAVASGAILICTIGTRLSGPCSAFSGTTVTPRTGAASEAGASPEANAAPETNTAPENSPVVLELFTSEGCSSCPPADELLSKIGASSTGVIPLAYHVDYWDSSAWSDPFSSSQWTARQAMYVRTMRLSSSYTPQIVINGRWQCVGSDPGGIASAIAAARTTPPPGLITLLTSPPDAGLHKLKVSVSAHMVRTAGNQSLIVMLVIYENGLTEKIGAGENSGHQIRYDYTVRKIVPVFELSGAAGSALENEFTVDLDPSWQLNRLGAAAFIQDENSLAIDGAATQYPLAKD